MTSSPPQHQPNYFNYFTEIEDVFVRRRGKHLLLSPMDWALIESWKEMKVPLHIALRGIEKAFDSWESKPRKRSVKSLLYCQEEVEAQYAEWLESRVGAESNSDDPSVAIDLSDEGLPFPRQAILKHLRRGQSVLHEAESERKRTTSDELTDAFARAAVLLLALESEFMQSAVPNAQKLEVSLSGLERMLSDAIRIVVDPENLAKTTSDVKAQLRPYRSHMDKVAYEQTKDNLLMKRLREQFGVPRLSLFYL